MIVVGLAVDASACRMDAVVVTAIADCIVVAIKTVVAVA